MVDHSLLPSHPSLAVRVTIDLIEEQQVVAPSSLKFGSRLTDDHGDADGDQVIRINRVSWPPVDYHQKGAKVLFFHRN